MFLKVPMSKVTKSAKSSTVSTATQTAAPKSKRRASQKPASGATEPKRRKWVLMERTLEKKAATIAKKAGVPIKKVIDRLPRITVEGVGTLSWQNSLLVIAAAKVAGVTPSWFINDMFHRYVREKEAMAA